MPAENPYSDAIFSVIQEYESHKKKAKKIIGKSNKQIQTELNRAEKLFSKGHFSAALPVFTQLLEKHPDNPDLLYHTGYVYYANREYTKAADVLQKLITLVPRHENGRKMLLAALNDGHMTDPMLSMAQKMKEGPLNDGEYLQAFSAFLAVCDWDRALPMLNKCIESILNDRVSAPLLPGFLLNILGLHNINSDTMYALTKKAAELSAQNIKYLPPKKEQCSVNKRIKLAYLSSDFRTHPVGYFIYSILAGHRKDHFEVFCYSGSTLRDEITESIAAEAEHFIDVSALNVEEIAQRIYQDGIHVLVDLGGHTENSKLQALAYHPAPVSIEYLGYANSTGYASVDFRITDPHVDVEDGTKYTETLLALPKSFLCFGMRPTCSRAEQAPVTRNGFITFGSFNHCRKLNPETIAAWSSILAGVSNSRLVLKGNWRGGTTSNNILNQFKIHGIKNERVIFLAHTKTYDDHVACYNEIDIALDTFPYSGTTTTCEALWMGVPVVTHVGKCHASRVSYSILKNIGFEETLCYSWDEYVAKAIQLANNPSGLTLLRPMLHILFEHSPVAHSDNFVLALEDLYLDACKQKGVNISQLTAPATAIEKETLDEPDTPHNADRSKIRKLHIGGKEKHPDWEIFDAIPSALTDHVGNANDLSMFEDNTFDAVYSSHVLEHFSYQGELSQVLAEWYRVLMPGGILYASVPNLEVLCELFLNKSELSPQDRFQVMRMMFGGQIDPFDFHKVGYNPEILASFLGQAGFENLRMLPKFGLFNDTSNMEFAGIPISLNLIGEKPMVTDNLVWLCSYPKSGNTMVRIAVENYFNQPTLSVYRHVTKGDNSPLFGNNYSNAIGIKCHKVSEVPKQAAMVYIYRDPRDVLISYFKWNTGEMPNENEAQFNSFIHSALHEWKAEIEQARQFSGKKCLIRYEDIIQNPVDTYEQIFSFICNDKAIDHDQLKKTIHNTTKEKAFQWFEKLGADNQVMPMEKKTTRWSELLNAEQIEQVTRILGKEFLSQLGYATHLE